MSRHLAALGLERGATAEEIKAAYRRASKLLHPDVNKDPDAGSKFSDLTEHYEAALAELTELRPDLRYTVEMVVRRVVQVGLEEAWVGFATTVTLHCGSVTVEFPPRSASGSFRVVVIGNVRLELVLEVSQHARYSVYGRIDIAMTERVPIDTLVLGGSVAVDYLGEQIELEIPEMCQPGFVLSRRGAGLKLGAATGDLYVRVEAAFPRDAESRETLKKRFQTP